MHPKIGLYILILLVAITMAGETLVIAKYQSPIGSDTKLHAQLASKLLNLEYPFGPLYPYPPAFHLTIAFLSVLFLADPLQIMAGLQVIMFGAVLSSTYFLLQKKTEPFVAGLCVLLLASSPAFWDRASQVIPQAIDLLLFPLMVYSYLQEKDRAFIALGTFAVYNHFAYSALPLMGLFLHSVLSRGNIKKFVPIALLSLPLVAFILQSYSGTMAESIGVQSSQEKASLEQPLFAIKYLGYPIFFLLPATAIHLKFRKPHDFENVILLWLLSLLPMAIYFPDRLVQYSAQPMAILVAISFAGYVKDDRARLALLLGLGLFSCASLIALYRAQILNGDVRIPLDSLSPFAV